MEWSLPILDTAAKFYSPFYDDPERTNVSPLGAKPLFMYKTLPVQDIYLTALGYDHDMDPFFGLPGQTVTFSNEPSLLSIFDAPSLSGRFILDDFDDQLLKAQRILALQQWLVALGPGGRTAVLANSEPFSLVSLMTVDPLTGFKIGVPTAHFAALAKKGIVRDPSILDGFIKQGIDLDTVPSPPFELSFQASTGKSPVPVLTSGRTAVPRLTGWLLGNDLQA
jgi:hypothetical protein